MNRLKRYVLTYGFPVAVISALAINQPALVRTMSWLEIVFATAILGTFTAVIRDSFMRSEDD